MSNHDSSGSNTCEEGLQRSGVQGESNTLIDSAAPAVWIRGHVSVSFRCNSRCCSSDQANFPTTASLTRGEQGLACELQASEGREPGFASPRHTRLQHGRLPPPAAPTRGGLPDPPQELRRIPADLRPAAQGGFAQGQGAAAAAGRAAALPVRVPSREA